jgi:hypothetical protein
VSRNGIGEDVMTLEPRSPDKPTLYERELPGGGFVAIEVADRGPDEPRCEGRISVERRVERERREGHNPPVIFQLQGDSSRTVFNELYRIAADNVAVARAILAWQSARRESANEHTAGV